MRTNDERGFKMTQNYVRKAGVEKLLKWEVEGWTKIQKGVGRLPLVSPPFCAYILAFHRSLDTYHSRDFPII